MMQYPILVVDDDAPLRAAVAEQLNDTGEFLPVEAATIAEAKACLEGDGARFGAMILDLGLPDGNGRELCATLRREKCGMPIIMLTGFDEESDVVQGLEAGANDYVVKPFRAGELLARLRAQLRGFQSSEDVVFAIGPYQFRPAAKLLVDPARNRKIWLTAKEASILKLLYRARGAVVARRALLIEVWGYSAAVTTHTLETHLYRLRQKIEPVPSRASLLITEGGGYRLEVAPHAGAA